jgi:hypothetical protein
MNSSQDKRVDSDRAKLLAHALGLQSQYGHEPARSYLEAHGFSHSLAYELLAMRFDRRQAGGCIASPKANWMP